MHGVLGRVGVDQVAMVHAAAQEHVGEARLQQIIGQICGPVADHLQQQVDGLFRSLVGRVGRGLAHAEQGGGAELKMWRFSIGLNHRQELLHSLADIAPRMEREQCGAHGVDRAGEAVRVVQLGFYLFCNAE